MKKVYPYVIEDYTPPSKPDTRPSRPKKNVYWTSSSDDWSSEEENNDNGRKHGPPQFYNPHPQFSYPPWNYLGFFTPIPMVPHPPPYTPLPRSVEDTAEDEQSSTERRVGDGWW